jgi:hypothetical protein
MVTACHRILRGIHAIIVRYSLDSCFSNRRLPHISMGSRMIHIHAQLGMSDSCYRPMLRRLSIRALLF